RGSPMRAMKRRTDSSSWNSFSTSIESSGRRIATEMESLCTSIPRWVNERCETLDTAGSFLHGAPSAFGLMIHDQLGSGGRPFHDDCGASVLVGVVLPGHGLV